MYCIYFYLWSNVIEIKVKIKNKEGNEEEFMIGKNLNHHHPIYIQDMVDFVLSLKSLSSLPVEGMTEDEIIKWTLAWSEEHKYDSKTPFISLLQAFQNHLFKERSKE